ncbi:MAG: transposase [bacterium]
MRTLEFCTGEYYHIYNRGVDKRDVFLDFLDYERFVSMLCLSNSKDTYYIRDIKKKFGDKFLGLETLLELRTESLVDIGAWCLMPNHFHLLIKEKEIGGLSKFLHKLETGYTGYFNKKNDRTGSLFQGTFKAEHVGSDKYLKYLFSYIHLNPIKLIDSTWKENGIKNIDKAIKYLNSYTRSSYLDFAVNNRIEGRLVNRSAFPDYFLNPVSFEKEIFEWLSYKHLQNQTKAKP